MALPVNLLIWLHPLQKNIFLLVFQTKKLALFSLGQYHGVTFLQEFYA